MPTVKSIAKQVELTANVSGKIFRTNLERANNSVLVKGPIDSAANFVNSDFGRQAKNEQIETYAEELENFNAEFSATMTSLQASSDRLKENFQTADDDKLKGVLSRLGGFALSEIPPEERDKVYEFQEEQRNKSRQHAEIVPPARDFDRFAAKYLVAETIENKLSNEVNQNLNATRDENVNAALSNVRNFVETFNRAVDYFNGNRSMSSRMNALADSFGDNAKLTPSLNAVGISVNEDGRLRVDERKLVDALNGNSSDVDAALGQNGLAGQLDRNINLANSQRENLFPSVAEYTGTADPTKSIYSAQMKLLING